MKEDDKKTLNISLSEERWKELTAIANGQQRSIESIIEEALTACIKKHNQKAPDERINPIEDTKPAKSFGFNSDVRGK